VLAASVNQTLTNLPNLLLQLRHPVRGENQRGSVVLVHRQGDEPARSISVNIDTRATVWALAETAAHGLSLKQPPRLPHKELLSVDFEFHADHLEIIAYIKEFLASRQSDRFQFREDRRHEPGMGSWAASGSRPLICGRATGNSDITRLGRNSALFIAPTMSLM
jgi:hypothetical protein